MARFQVTSPDGRIVTLEGDTPPTDADLDEVFSSLPTKLSEEKPSRFGTLAGSFAVGGAPGFGVTPGSEEVLPMVGQALGTPFGFGGSVAGEVVGDVARQGIKKIRGEKTDFQGVLPRAAETATIEGMMRGAGKIAKPLAGRLMNSILKPATKQLVKGKNLGLEAAEAGISGTKKGMFGQAQSMVDVGESELQNLIKTTPGSVDLTKALSGLDALEQKALSIGDQAGVTAVQNLKQAIGSGRLNLESANQLKRNLYDALRESQFGTNEVPVLATARKSAARGLKEGIEDVLPQAKDINRRIGLGGRVRDALARRNAVEERQVILPFFEGAGAFGGILSGHPEYAALIAGRRLMDTPLVKSMVAKSLLGASKTPSIGRGASLAASEGSRRLFGDN